MTTFQFLSEADLDALPDPVWLVEGLLIEKSLGVLYGASGAGKTFIALALAGAICVGADFLGRSVAEGHVLYVAAESHWQLKKRLRALRRHLGVRQLGALSVVPMPVHFHSPDEVAEFITQLAAQQPEGYALTIVDTLSRCSAGMDENLTAHRELSLDGIRQVMDATGGAVLLLHHTGWKTDRERGSSALRAAVDTLLKLEEDGNSTLTLEVEKQRDGETGFRLGIHLLPVGDSLVAIADEANASPATLSAKALACLRSLHAIALSDGATVSDWKAHFEDVAKRGRSVFFESKKELLLRNLVTPVNKRWALTPAGIETVRSPGTVQMESGWTESVQSGESTIPLGMDSGLQTAWMDANNRPAA